MTNINNDLIDELVEVIYKRIEEKFEKKINTANVEHSAVGVVREEIIDDSGNLVGSTKDSSGNITHTNVELSFKTLANVVNKTGESLVEGDKVKIFYNNSNMNGVYIGVKF